MSVALPSLPKTQRAFVVPSPGPSYELKFIQDLPVPDPATLQPGQCLVKLDYSGVCHSDITLAKGLGPPSKQNLVGGHEGIGTIVAFGPHSDISGVNVKLGDRVGVKFIADCCRSCESCAAGHEGLCSQVKFTGAGLDGTFCEYVVTYTRHAIPIPEKLPSADASAIMCAGVTVYSALRQSGAHVGQWVVIGGAGGGLGHLAIQYAAAMGLRVLALDTGAAKRELALALGASAFVDFAAPSVGYTDAISEIIAITDGKGAHVALVCAGSARAYSDAAKYLRASGTLMVVGIPPGVLEIPFGFMVGKGLTVKGLTTGSSQVTLEALELAAQGRVRCHYTLRGLSELPKVYEELEKGQVVGRIVLDIAK